MSFQHWKTKKLIQSFIEEEEAPKPRSKAPAGVHARLKDSEQLFVDWITHERPVQVYRNGWPDFAIQDTKTGKVEFVEVKWTKGDRLSGAQQRMAELLTRMGISVFVWTPSEPTRLVPWRVFNRR